MGKRFDEFKEDFSMLLDNLKDVDYPPVAVFWLLVAGCAIAGCIVGAKSLINKADAKTTFDIKEVGVLGKFGEMDVSGNGLTVLNQRVETKQDYKLILDIDNDGVYNESVDTIFTVDNVLFTISEKGDKITFIEEKRPLVTNMKVVAVKDKNGECKCKTKEECYNEKRYAENESFQRINQILKDEQLNQR